MLDNHREDVSYVYDRMAHVHHAISGNVDPVLCKASGEDIWIISSRGWIWRLASEVWIGIRPIAKERGIDVKTDVRP